MNSSWRGLSATASSTDDDRARAIREWRWRCYTDHLRDLGYDLDGGQPRLEEPLPWSPLRSGASTSASADAG